MKLSLREAVSRYYKSNRRSAVLAGFLTVISYVLLATGNSIRFDSADLASSPENIFAGFLTVGRFGLALLKKMLFLTTYQPVKSGVLFLFFMILTTQALCILFFWYSDGAEGYPYLMFSLLFGTSPLWGAQAYFVLQEAEVSLAVLLSVLAAGGLTYAAFSDNMRSKLLWCPLGAILLILSIGTYQSCAVLYVTTVVCLFLLLLYHRADRRSPNSVPRGLALLILHFGLSYLGYHWIAHKFFWSLGSYPEHFIRWGKDAPGAILFTVAKAVLKTLLLRHIFYFTLYPLGAALMVFLFIKYRPEIKSRLGKNTFWFWTAVTGLLLLPFSLDIAFGTEIAPRMQFALQLVVPFLLFFSCNILTEKWYNVKKALILFGIVFGCLQVLQDARFVYTDHVRYSEDRAYAAELADRLEDRGAGAKPVIFLGAHETVRGFPYINIEAVGVSFFAATDGTGRADEYRTGSAQFLEYYLGLKVSTEYPEEWLTEALAQAGDRVAFPAQDGLWETDRYIAVKLGDTQEY